jgi:hypothetical protein
MVPPCWLGLAVQTVNGLMLRFGCIGFDLFPFNNIA